MSYQKSGSSTYGKKVRSPIAFTPSTLKALPAPTRYSYHGHFETPKSGAQLEQDELDAEAVREYLRELAERKPGMAKK
jgi:hypothetical protein